MSSDDVGTASDSWSKSKPEPRRVPRLVCVTCPCSVVECCRIRTARLFIRLLYATGSLMDWCVTCSVYHHNFQDRFCTSFTYETCNISPAKVTRCLTVLFSMHTGQVIGTAHAWETNKRRVPSLVSTHGPTAQATGGAWQEHRRHRRLRQAVSGVCTPHCGQSYKASIALAVLPARATYLYERLPWHFTVHMPPTQAWQVEDSSYRHERTDK